MRFAYEPHREGLSVAAERYRDDSLGRLTCTTCHDPHEAASRQADPYVGVCLGCHPAESTEASVGRGRAVEENCLPRHMPRTAPNAYLEFTGHRIRILKEAAGR